MVDIQYSDLIFKALSRYISHCDTAKIAKKEQYWVKNSFPLFQFNSLIMCMSSTPSVFQNGVNFAYFLGKCSEHNSSATLMKHTCTGRQVQLQPSTMIANNVAMLQAGQHFNFPQYLWAKKKKKNQICLWWLTLKVQSHVLYFTIANA